MTNHKLPHCVKTLPADVLPYRAVVQGIEITHPRLRMIGRERCERMHPVILRAVQEQGLRRNWSKLNVRAICEALDALPMPEGQSA